MTVRQIVTTLRSQGHKVTFRKRSDGGIRITSIDKVKFKGSAGNKMARGITGQVLSENREVQLTYAKVAKKWKRGNLPSSVGELNYAQVKRTYKKEGLVETKRRLSEKEKYAAGIAYSKVVDALVGHINQLGDLLESAALHALADEIKKNETSIRDEWILPAYEELYRFNTEPITDELIKDVIRNVKSILRI